MPNDEGDYNFLRRELTIQGHDEHGHPKDNGNLATDAAALGLDNIEAYNITSYVCSAGLFSRTDTHSLWHTHNCASIRLQATF